MQCNHEVDKSAIEKIEKTINDMLIDNYIDEKSYKDKLQMHKDQEKQHLLNQKQMKDYNKMKEKEEREYKALISNQSKTKNQKKSSLY